MHCLYCRHLNVEDEHRCERCGSSGCRPCPRGRGPVGRGGAATALAAAEAPVLARQNREDAEVIPPQPQRPQIPRQTRLFAEAESSKVLAFPTASKPPEPRQPRQRRQAPRPPDSQAFLDFLPPAPHAPRTLKTSVEAVIYCDAPVATLTHRAVAFSIDFSLVTVASLAVPGHIPLPGRRLWQARRLRRAGFLAGPFWASRCSTGSCRFMRIGIGRRTMDRIAADQLRWHEHQPSGTRSPLPGCVLEFPVGGPGRPLGAGR